MIVLPVKWSWKSFSVDGRENFLRNIFRMHARLDKESNAFLSPHIIKPVWCLNMFNTHHMMVVLFAKQQKLALTRPMAGRHIVLKSKRPFQDLNQDIIYVPQISIYSPDWNLHFNLHRFCFNYSLLHFPEFFVLLVSFLCYSFQIFLKFPVWLFQL